MNKFGFVLLALFAFTGANKPFRPHLDGRIVGGYDVDIKDYPHQLSMEYYGYHICGASIIDANWVLTASHCVHRLRASDIAFRAGSSIVGEGGTLHQASEIHMHPKYGNSDWDYALVKVAEPFAVGRENEAAIKLAESDPADRTKVTVSGWGALSSGGSSPSQLQAVDVYVVNRNDCNAAYGTITPRMICAGDTGKDSCQGDSGGPLIDPATNELVGIVSWGYGCAEPDYPGVYSDVAFAREWIKQTCGV